MSEIQLMEFVMGDHSYGINALRIKQVIQFHPSQLRPIPGVDPAILGTVLFQEQSVPTVDLVAHLNIEGGSKPRFQTVLICELNNQVSGFLVDDIRTMSTVQVDEIQQRNYNAQKEKVPVTGMVNHNGEQVLLLDFKTSSVTSSVQTSPISTSTASSGKRTSPQERFFWWTTPHRSDT